MTSDLRKNLAAVVADFPLPTAADFIASYDGQQDLHKFATDTNVAPTKVSRRPKRTSTVRLAAHLESLEQHDPQRVFVAKRIARLGLENGRVLREHFEAYGPVAEVMLVNSPAPNTQPVGTRFRPSGMGYVLMQNAADVDKILREADESGQVMVGEAPITVSRFWSRAGIANRDNTDVCGLVSDTKKCNFGDASFISL